MSKYTIVHKSCKGNKANTVCTVEYQVEGYATSVFKTELLCLKNAENKYFYAFLDGRVGPHIDTSEDKAKFLDEFYEYQKGYSYRVKNPIKKSIRDNLEEEITSLESQLEKAKLRLREYDSEQHKLAFEHYKEDIDEVSLNSYIFNVSQAINANSRYYLNPIIHLFDGYKLEVIDRELKRIVKIGEISKAGVVFRDLNEYEYRQDIE